MPTVLEPEKVRIASRVVEVLEYFDATHPTATVSDIVRRYGRPQSSTSELLASLCEIGLLFKDPQTRSYRPTPRLSALGTNGQPPGIGDGRLFGFMDRVSRFCRQSVALLGMVGTHVQLFHWSPGPEPLSDEIRRGMSEPLFASAAGLLLLSAIDPERVSPLLHRLNSEALPQDKFNPRELLERIGNFGRLGHASGPAGFVADAQMTAILLPGIDKKWPLALAFVHEKGAPLDQKALVRTLQRCAAITTQVCNASDTFELTCDPLMAAV